MSMITVNVNGEHITGFVNGQPFSVQFDEQRYASMKDLESKAAQATTTEQLKMVLEEFKPFTIENYKELIEHAKGGQYLWVNRANGHVYLAINGKVSREALPSQIVDRIVYAVEKKLDIQPLVKAWARFLRNPHYTYEKAKRFARYINTTVVNSALKTKLMEEQHLSESIANKAATMYDVSFTQEGLIATYKVVREIDWKFVSDGNTDGGVKKVDRFEYEVDEFTGLKTYKKPDYLEDRVFEPSVQRQSGDAFYSDNYLGHIVRVGKLSALDSWDKVNCHDGQSCVKGLHIGGLTYIAHYQHDDTITLNTFVDPMHIGAITDDGTGALRVLKYFPHSALDIPTQNLYHSSTYARLTDEEYNQMFEEAVKAHDFISQEAADKLEQKRNLL